MRYLAAIIALPFAVFAAPDDTAVANRKWVRETLRQYATSTAVQDEELHCDGTNIWVYVLEEENGVLTNRPYYFEAEIRTVTGDKRGAVVVQSDNSQVPAGTLFAACKGSSQVLCNRAKSLIYTHPSGGTLDLGPLFSGKMEEHVLSDHYGVYTNYTLSGAITNTYTNVFSYARLNVQREITSVPSHSQFMDVTETVWITSSEGFQDTRVYHYRLSGTRMSDTAFSRISANAEHYPWRWSDISGHRTAEQYIILQQQSETAAAGNWLRSLMFPSAYADNITEIVSPLPLRSMPVVDLVDAFLYAYNGETKDTHWPLPDEFVPSREQWYDPLRWFQSYPENPFPIFVLVDVTLSSGKVYRGKKTRINSVEALERLGVKITAYDWTAPTFVKKEEQCARGHIYGADCVCIVCQTATREHSYAFDHVQAGQCARCVHQHDGWKTDRFGVKIPNGKKLEEVCNAHNTTSGDLALHRGWRASEHPDDDRYYCDCECGFYHDVETLQHSLPEEDTIATWTDLEDGVHHYADLDCQRECGGSHRVLQPHTPDVNAELPEGEEQKYEPFDDTEHLTWAKCSANGCSFLGWVPEAHTFDESNPCYCIKCKEHIHTWASVGCGRFQNYYCSKCGLAQGDGEERHEYGFILEEGDVDFNSKVDTHHKCACGKGELEKHVFKNGVCFICGYEKATDDRMKCAGKRKSDGSTVTKEDHTPGEWYDRNVLSGGDALADGMGGERCPDCGGNFFTDNPKAWNYKSITSEMYFYTYFSPPSGGRAVVKGYSTHLGSGLDSAMASYEALLGTWTENRDFLNMPFSIVIEHSPSTNIITDAFTGKIYTNVHYHEANYSGTVVEDDDDGTLHIKWD